MLYITLLCVLLSARSSFGQVSVNVNFNNVTHTVSPNLFGIFFEEINHAGEGGLYAELVNDRGFNGGPISGPWQPLGASKISIEYGGVPLNEKNKLSGRITTTSPNAGITNSGFWGINVQNDKYSLSYFVRTDGSFKGQLVITLEDQAGNKVYGKVTDDGPFTSTWTKRTFTFEDIVGNDPNARLAIRLSSAGTIWLDEVSLFPTTFNNRPNGLRKDLANVLQDLSPKFLRFPGGSYVEGYDAVSAYHWKNTTGPTEERPGHPGLWGYYSTDGLGLLEYLLLCEDLKMEPLWVISAGIFTGDKAVPLNELGPWVQDALDSLEYITGPASSTWGSLRAKDGHPEPFNLQWATIGNENGCNFDTNHIYVNYYNAFAQRIRAAYPKIKIIANCDISSSTKDIDLYDFHVYASTQWFLQQATIFDRQNRRGPAIFVSEYAVKDDAGNGNLKAAVAEAAFMTGLVRNSDIVQLASYAPLFVNVNNRAWTPDLIQFNSHQVAPIPSYYVQMLFMKYTGDKHLETGRSGGGINFATVATYSSIHNVIYMPIVNFSPSTTSVDIKISGASKIGSSSTVYVVSSPSGNPADENVLGEAPRVTIIESTVATSANFVFKALPYSVSVIVIPAAK